MDGLGAGGRWWWWEGEGVTLHRGDDYSCIHSVFNQWIKLSIYSSIDVSYDKCLSMLSRPARRHWRPFNHRSQRWGDAEKAHGSGASGSSRVFNYPAAAAAVHTEDKAGGAGGAGGAVAGTVKNRLRRQCSTRLFYPPPPQPLLRWHLVNMDPFLCDPLPSEQQQLLIAAQFASSQSQSFTLLRKTHIHIEYIRKVGVVIGECTFIILNDPG